MVLMTLTGSSNSQLQYMSLGSWGYSVVPSLDYSTARSLIRRSLGSETAVPTKSDQIKLDLSNLKIGYDYGFNIPKHALRNCK
jgi:hypothetical protein